MTGGGSMLYWNSDDWQSEQVVASPLVGRVSDFLEWAAGANRSEGLRRRGGG
jgi:hypothetical protein